MSVLENVIGLINSATGLEVKALDTDNANDCIVYQYYTVSDNGAVAQVKLQLRIIAHSLNDVLSYEKQIKNVLLCAGDISKVEGVKSIELNGGGTLKDYETNTIQNILYFIITKRSEVE